MVKKIFFLLVTAAILIVPAWAFLTKAGPLKYQALPATVSSLNQTGDEPAALTNYRLGMTGIDARWPNQSAKDLLAAVLKTAQSRNADDLTPVIEAKAGYRQILRELSLLPVPASLLSEEEALVAAVTKITATLELMAGAATNPTAALAAAQVYPADLTTLGQAVNALRVRLAKI
jgi:hypothetical protein